MAAKDIVFGSTGQYKEIDIVDIAALVLLPLAASLQFGVFSWTINVFGGYDFTQTLWTIAGANITPVMLVTVLSFGWIVATNLANQKTEMDQYEFGAVLLSLALPILYVLVPAVADLINATDIGKLAAVLYVSAGAVYVSYSG
jgi:hypothetical protein